MTEGIEPAADLGDALNGAIARRLALLRRTRGMSLDDVASRCGVSKGMVVQIEQGRANPSIGTLCRLAAGLGVAVVDLLAPEDPSPRWVQVQGPERARLLWEGTNGGSATLVVGSPGPDMLELWEWVLQPGERYEARPHSAGTLELIHVERGTLRIEVNGLEERVDKGASAIARTDRAHAYACEGRRPVRFSMVVYEPTSTGASSGRADLA